MDTTEPLLNNNKSLYFIVEPSSMCSKSNLCRDYALFEQLIFQFCDIRSISYNLIIFWHLTTQSQCHCQPNDKATHGMWKIPHIVHLWPNVPFPEYPCSHRIVCSEHKQFLILMKYKLFFSLLLPMLLVSYLRNHCQIQGHKKFPLCFLLRVQ